MSWPSRSGPVASARKRHTFSRIAATACRVYVYPTTSHIVAKAHDVCRTGATFRAIARRVVSCPEMTTLDPEGAPPYDQHAMDYVLGLQQQGYMRLGFDRAGSSTARSEDAPLFASGDPEKIKETMWFYGYATATKRCISLESQNFDGLLELVCIDGGPVTSIEAREMPRILAESVHDAELLEVEIQCEFKISQMAYCDFVREYRIQASARAWIGRLRTRVASSPRLGARRHRCSVGSARGCRRGPRPTTAEACWRCRSARLMLLLVVAPACTCRQAEFE